MEDVAVKIEGAASGFGEEFRFWSSLEVTLGLDTYDAFSLRAPFEADRAEFRETFRPFEFRDITITVDDVALFTGTIVKIQPSVSAESSSVEVSGYARAGVLTDCSAPAELLPLEFNKMGLRAISERLAGAFGLAVEFQHKEGGAFEKVALDEDRKVHDFLSELARQRNLVITSNPRGDLLIWQSLEPEVSLPVARLVSGETPVVSVEPAFNEQEYYSEITGYAQARRGRVGSKHTERNPFLSSSTRPHAFKLDDTEKADAPEATRANLARMFGNIVSYNVRVPTWRDADGAIWSPNSAITLLAPDAMVYEETEMLIRTVTLSQDAEGESAVLGVVLPGAFAGFLPRVLPWQE
jgi:prophage tail gpP-like protein